MGAPATQWAWRPSVTGGWACFGDGFRVCAAGAATALPSVPPITATCAGGTHQYVAASSGRCDDAANGAGWIITPAECEEAMRDAGRTYGGAIDQD